MNRNLDDSIGLKKKSHLVQASKKSKGSKKSCFRVAHWDTGKPITDGGKIFCVSDNPRYKEGDRLEVVVHAGYFNIPWYEKVEFIKYQSPENAIKELNGELNLRFIDVQIISNKLGVKIWSNFYKQWSHDCFSAKPSHCRLASYISTMMGEKEKTYKAMKHGCIKKDFYTCYNLLVQNEISSADKNMATSSILEQCGGDLNFDKKEICNIAKTYKD